jgi:hypothetical protein
LHDPGHVARRKVFLPADVSTGDERDAFFAELVHAALDDALVELHVRDAVHEQAADAVGPLVDSDGVAGFVELGGGGETRGPAADDGDSLTGAILRNARRDPAFFPAAVDDRVLDVLDGDRRAGDAEHAGALARRRAGAARELGEVVGLVEPLERVAPAALVDHVVPLGNEIVDRAAMVRLAEGNAAVHAASALRHEVLDGGVGEDLEKVAGALDGIPVGDGFSWVFFKSGGLSHY